MDFKKKREQLNTFFKAHTRLQYKKGETIIRPEDDPSGIFLIEWGFIKAYGITKYGEENILLVRGPGGLFPLIWLFTDEHRHVSYEAMEPTSLWRVSKDDCLAFLDEHPDIMPVIVRLAIEAYRRHSERVMTLCYRTARERIMSFLVVSARSFGEKRKDGAIIIKAPFKQSDIASSVNATRETTSREINALKKKGWIAMEDGCIVIYDINILKSSL